MNHIRKLTDKFFVVKANSSHKQRGYEKLYKLYSMKPIGRKAFDTIYVNTPNSCIVGGDSVQSGMY